MQDHPGVFIVIEGSDGSGKATQLRLLKERLMAAGYDVADFDFPRYDQPSTHFVRKYLAGDYGPSDSINPYTASMFYALDRYEASHDIKKALAEGKVVISNRYVGSNMAHQGAKFGSEGEKRGFFMWEDSLEYQLLGLPRPATNIFLHLPAKISQKLIVERAKQKGIELDEHEKNLAFLQKSVESYELLCRLFPKDYAMVECSENGKLLSIPAINNKVWNLLKPYIGPVPRHAGMAKIVSLEQVNKTSAQLETKTSEIVSSQVLQLRDLLESQKVKFRAISRTTKKPAKFPAEVGKEAMVLQKSTISFINMLSQKLATETKMSKKQRRAALEETAAALQPLGTVLELELVNKLPEDEINKSPSKKVTKIAEQVEPNYSQAEVGARLLSANPRSELELLNLSVFGSSEAGYQELAESVDEASYEKKSRWLDELLADSNASYLVANSVVYGFEVVCSGLDMEQLLNSANWLAVKAQAPNPRLGYIIPTAVDKAGLAEQYSECFDSSLALYSRLQAIKPQLAQNACLRGHNVRFIGYITLEQLELLKEALLDGKALKMLVREARNAHPLLFSATK